MRKTLFLCLLIFFSIKSYADGTKISGNVSVLGETTEIYYVNWENWTTTHAAYANVSWNITGGYVITSDKTSVTIQWDSPSGLADGTGVIEVVEDLGGQNGQLEIVIENNSVSSSDFCTGILGPAKVYVDFGSGSNPGAALSTGSTSYQYSASCALNLGEYTISNSSNLCRAGWHNISADHTGNPNGYFMMVNASSQRSEIFRTTVTGLTTSFRYQFSAWVGNLFTYSGGQDPNIRFEVYDLNGILLGTSGSIVVAQTLPTFQWQQIGFMFDLPQNVSAIQVVVVNARTNTNDFGNDFVIDDISFAPCYPGILASFANATIIDKEHTCNNGTVPLYTVWAGTIPFSNTAYQWQRTNDGGATWTNISGATSATYTQTETSPGIYQYRMYAYESSNSSSFVISNAITYYVQTLVVTAKTFDLYACNGASVTGQLPAYFDFLYSDPADIQSYSYAWSPVTYLNNPNVSVVYFSLPGVPPPSGTIPAPVTNYTYSLTVTNTTYGCSASATQTVAVHNPRKVGVPNAFTPTLSINNIFYPINLEDYPGSEFSIYNRWGTRVFHSFGPTKLDYGWNGTYNGVVQPQDAYIWTISFVGCPAWIIGSRGEGYTTGDVTLLR